MCKHWDCVCYSPGTETCDYLLHYGKRRGCLPTDDCIHYITDFRQNKPLRPLYAVRKVDLNLVRKMEEIYDPEKNAYDMADDNGISRVVMLSWIRKTHPEHRLVAGGSYDGY